MRVFYVLLRAEDVHSEGTGTRLQPDSAHHEDVRRLNLDDLPFVISDLSFACVRTFSKGGTNGLKGIE